ncbi:MAG: DNA mismatch repair endonuclease MutL [Rubrobacter sp.]|nr:DNA mismatch repair endonuclease MutL [Rubrobacter sp.]
MKLFPRFVSEASAEYGERVRVLAPEVAHRIAAGEVVERPASAVKELVENSLDAGASRIEVEIEGGGARLIRVSDDGSGMSEGDAERAVMRHATSKIETADDLALVESLGFRGEALHAIGAVSHLSLTTRVAGTPHGVRVEVAAGVVVGARAASHPPGTTVEARSLFLNLPVRRGFLGTERAEANAVVSVVSGLALGRPDVGFFLSVDGRGMLAFPAAGDLRERISQIHGLPLAKSLIPLDDEVVWGFISPASLGFPTRRHFHVAVNGRVVEGDSFAPAVAKAYADLLPKGRHPAAFLRLELGPGEVDVNVHPAKSAVRLRGGRSAYPLVVGAIRNALSMGKSPGDGADSEGEPSELSLIGQFAGRFIVADDGGDSLVVLDQHGAHERILYERLSKEPEGKPISLEPPAIARMPEGLMSEVWAFEERLKILGFEVEPFGDVAVRIISAPETADDPEAALVAAVEALMGGEDLAKALACKGSRKFGEELSRVEMERMLEEWMSCEFPYITQVASYRH